MTHALIARQPIVDAEIRVQGYELLYRSQLTGPLAGFDGSVSVLAEDGTGWLWYRVY